MSELVSLMNRLGIKIESYVGPENLILASPTFFTENRIWFGNTYTNGRVKASGFTVTVPEPVWRALLEWWTEAKSPSESRGFKAFGLDWWRKPETQERRKESWTQ